MLRYHIAIGFSQGKYDYISPIISYPRGQAIIGNIPSILEYNSKIPVSKKSLLESSCN